jgi:hypothetical protein
MRRFIGYFSQTFGTAVTLQLQHQFHESTKQNDMEMKTTNTAKGWRFASVAKLLSVFCFLAIGLLSTETQAQIALRGTTSATTGSNNSFDVARHANLAEGDFMIACVMSSAGSSASLSDPTMTGWTVITGSTLSSSSNRWRGTLLYKVATASDVAADEFTVDNDNDATGSQCVISVFTGVDASNPFDVTPGGAFTNIGSDSTVNATAISTTTANAAVVAFGIYADNTGMGNFTATSPAFTEIFDAPLNASVDLGMAAAWGTKAATGTTGAGSAGIGASVQNGGIMIALRRFTGTITTGAVSTSLCAGSSVSVPYTITGTYASGNVFTAQLSNASGSFASPVAIGSAAVTTAGSVSATIPGGTANGTGYRIRVVSSLSPATGSNNGTNISINAPATAVAGSPVMACQGATSINITAGASASNNAGINWTHNGTGSIANPTSLTTAAYSPGPGETGTVILTLTATGNGGCGNVIDAKNLILVAPPTASAGGSATICSNQTHVVSGASASGGTIAWTEDGAGSITAGANTLTPTYTAAAGDTTVTLTMTVSNGTCADAVATYTINVTTAPSASAGSAFSTCENSGAISITGGASASNHNGILWTTSGDGTFTDANSLSLAMYTPGANDISTGSVTLTLTAMGNGPCGNETSNKILTINPIPDTTGAVICAGQNGFLTSSYACPSGAPVSTGATLPGAGATGGSGTAWTSPGNVLSNDDAYANVSATAGFSNVNVTSQSLNATGFGFTIPANATILGIHATVARHRSASALAGEAQDNSIRLLKGGVATGTNKGATSTNWPTSETNAAYGGASDLWGTTWTPAEVNASDFGLGVVADVSAFLGTRTANVDFVSIDITYTVPGDITWYTESSGGSPIGTGSSFNPVGVAGSPLANTNTPGVTTFYAECSNVPGCRTPTTFTINPLPEVSFTGLDVSYCGTAASIVLTGNHPGGIFQGAGITDNGNGTATFNPAAAGAGTHNINYSFADENGCANDQIQSVDVIAPTTYYADVDEDGFGDLDSTALSCTGAPEGYVADSSDCNDNQLQYLDADADGFGSATLVACGVTNNTDCDDAVLNYLDADNDGFGSATFVNCGGVLNNTDCDDNLLLYSDDDGDGFGSDTLLDCGGVTNTLDCDDNAIQYLDADGDGFGTNVQVACGVTNNTDCDDNDDTKNAMFDFYADADGDGFGSGDLESVCAVDAVTPPAGYSSNDTDCDAGDGLIWQTGTLYVDADNDGYNNGSTEDVCYGAGVPSGYALTDIGLDCNDAVSAINPGHAEVLYNGIDDNCDGQLDEGFQYTTEMFASQCATTLTTINSFIVFTSKANVTMYRFEVTDVATGNTQILERTQNYFSPTMLPSSNYQTTYSVRCEIQRNGIWLGYYGPSCLISTPAVLNPGGPGTISPSQCGGTLPTISTLIATTSLPNVTGYRFRVTNATDPFAPNQVQVIDRGAFNWFALTMLSNFNYGTTYLVEVSLKVNGGAFSAYGSPCAVSSPNVPMLNQCGTQISSAGALVSTASLDRVTAYRFYITDMNTSQVTTLDRTRNWFTFNNVPGYTPGGLYGVQVAIMTSGHFSPVGEGCEIVAPAAVARGNGKAVAFDAVAYPNPFAESFSIRVETASEEDFTIKVYDMTGRLVENRKASLLDMQTLTVGEGYPAGVYNVVLGQGTETESLRVIKR